MLLMVIFVSFLKLLLDNVFGFFLLVEFLDSFLAEIFFWRLASLSWESFPSDVALRLVVLGIYGLVVLHVAANFLQLINYKWSSKKEFGVFLFSHSSQES